MNAKATILIVDDEPDVREVLEEYFAAHGYTAVALGTVFLNEAIGSALVTTAAATAPLAVDIRGTKINLQLVKPPFVELKKQSS